MAWQTYYIEMEKLAKRIMKAFAEALSLEREFFEEYIKHPLSALRALHYPMVGNEFLKGQQRAGAHTDYGSLTILLPEEGSTGLQVYSGRLWVIIVDLRYFSLFEDFSL